MKYEEMKVVELREECRSRGLQIYTHGHKLTKGELINELNQHDFENHMDNISEQIEAEKESKPEEKGVVEKKSYIKFAETIEQIEQKYKRRRSDEIYDKFLKIGARVAFIQEITLRHGDVVKKLRSGDVVNVNRSKELVKVQLPYGNIVLLSFDELLFIREIDAFYPKDIYKMLVKQAKERRERLSRWDKKESDGDDDDEDW